LASSAKIYVATQSSHSVAATPHRPRRQAAILPHHRKPLAQHARETGRMAAALSEGVEQSDMRDSPQEGSMGWNKSGRIAAAATMAAVIVGASAIGWRASAQEAAPKAPDKDYNQRSLEIYEFRKAAQSGAERGQEIFYYKCW